MKSFSTVGLVASLITSVISQDDYPRRGAVEFHARGGICHLLAKIKEGGGKEIRVLFLLLTMTFFPAH